MSAFLESLTNAVARSMHDETAPLLVHTDVFRARAAIETTREPHLMLERHMRALTAITGSHPLALPAFNYDFPKTRVYAPATDAAQVGVLAEHARTAWSGGRRGPPIFNFTCRAVGTKDPFDVPCAGTVDPFGTDSVFGSVHRGGGRILMYGAPWHTLTAIHYVERLSGFGASGGPAYRYDKVFEGTVRHIDGRVEPVALSYHCRPMGRALEYDWPRLREEAEREGVVEVFRAPGSEALLIDLPMLSAFWLHHLASDPLYLLDAPSRAWVEKDLSRLGRRFLRSDFEEVP